MFVLVATTLVIGTSVYVGLDFLRARERASASPRVATVKVATIAGQPRIVFRNTEVGSKYGLVSMVSLADPGGPRAFTAVACDRVYATTDEAACLKTKRGIATTFQAQQLGPDWQPERSWPLPGVPSRTRLSADGRLMASTSFVTGHSYMQLGFSTATEIHRVSGHSYGNLEKFALRIGGKRVNPIDRNVWGVTFADDDNTFYATVATAGTPYLVRGDLRARTLTGIRRIAECPSLSPDGSEVAYKKNAGGSTPHWSIAVLDLATGRETVLAGESRSVDDQVEWLDADTLLYGMPRSGQAGVSDVWAIKTDAAASPVLFIKQAWSPSVVRR